MSKKLEKRETRLLHEAEERARAIRRVVREYRDAIRARTGADGVRRIERHHELERAVLRYNEVHKELRKLRKRIQLGD